MTKISFIGSGRVGSTSAFLCLNLAKEIALVDINKELAEGEAMDLEQASYAFQNPVKVYGSDDFSIIEDSEIIVVTAGVARKPGITRLDLAKTNAKIVKNVAENIKKFSPESIIIVVTNPVELMTYLVYKTLDIERSKVMGMGNYLDTARLWNLSGRISESFVMGEHGENMFVFGDLESKRFEDSVRKSSIEVIKRKGATFFAPAASVYRMVNAVLNDAKEQMPLAAVLEGEYGIKDMALGIPAILGRNGIEKIIEIPEVREKLEEIAKNLKVKLKEVIHN